MDRSGSTPGRRLRRLAQLGAAALLAWHAGSPALAAEPPAARKPATHTVAMEATAFSPPALVVRRGDTVVWVNRDPFPHTVTAGDGTFDSKIVLSGRSWRHVARKLGEHQYGCTLHPTMKGKVTVE
jgi:plastocyanin